MLGGLAKWPIVRACGAWCRGFMGILAGLAELSFFEASIRQRSFVQCEKQAVALKELNLNYRIIDIS